MPRDLVLDFRQGGGSVPEVPFGIVRIWGTEIRPNATSLVLTTETTLKLSEGKATLLNAQTSGTGPLYEWAYIIQVEPFHGRNFRFYVAIPDGTGAVNLKDLPKLNPITGEGFYLDLKEWLELYGGLPDRVDMLEDNQGVLQNDVADLKVLGGLAPGDVNDATTANLIETEGTQTKTALSATIGEEAPAYSGTPSPREIKAAGDTRPGVWEFESRSSVGYVWHVMARAGFAGGALMGLGLEADSSGGSALLISMKSATGAASGISMADRGDLHAGSKMIDLYMSNTTGARGLVIQQTAAGGGAALHIATGAAMGATQRLVEIYSQTGTVLSIASQSGITKIHKNLQIPNTGKLDLHRSPDAPMDTENHIVADGNNLELRTYAGTAGTYFPKRVTHSGQSLKFDIADTTTGGAYATPAAWATGLEIKTGPSAGTTALGFFGVAPVGRRAAIAAPAAGTTIDAEARSAINAIRAALTTLGLTA